MAPRPPTAPKPAPKGSAKIAGVPIGIVALGVVAAIGIGLYLRHRSATQPASAANPSAATDSSGAGGAASGPDPSATLSLADAINGLTGVLGGGGTFTVGTTAGGDGGSSASPTDAPLSASPAAQAPTAQVPTTTSPDLSAYQNYTLASHYDTLSPQQQQELFPIGPPIYSPAPASTITGGPPAPTPTTVGGPTPGTFTQTIVPWNAWSPATIPTPPHTTATLVTPAQTAHAEAQAKTAATRATGTHTAGL